MRPGISASRDEGHLDLGAAASADRARRCLRRQELGSLTPRSFRLDDDQPILKVAAACSKHRREDTLPMHPELVIMVREWVRDLGPDDLLFPRIERKKTWYMVKKDLERIGIPYETHEGIADFHAAGRHSHITGLLRNGATLVEARELARHADVRMTMKYTHIGLQDQADALAGLPLPKTCTNADWPGIGRVSGGVLGQDVSADDSDDDPDDDPENEETPSREGVSSPSVTDFQEVSVDLISGGGGNCTRVPDFATNSGTCGYGNRSYPWSEMGREAESLREASIAAVPSLPPHIVQAILALVRTAVVDAEGFVVTMSGKHTIL